MNPFETALVFLSGTLVLFFGVMLALARSVRKHVEEALRESADDEDKQAEIRNRVVKAVFPPRFYR